MADGRTRLRKAALCIDIHILAEAVARLGTDILQQFRRDLHHKAGRRLDLVQHEAVSHRIREEQLLLRTGHRHIDQPSFLLQRRIAAFAHTAFAGEDPLAQIVDEHTVELQPLGGMHRHQLYDVISLIQVIVRI